MKKEKMKSLERYIQDLNNKLGSGIPDKHKDHPESYKRFLTREIESTKRKVEQARLEMSVK